MAVWEVFPCDEKLTEHPVGGYSCSLELFDDRHLLVAGWDDDVPGFVREVDAPGNRVWPLEGIKEFQSGP